MLLFDSLKEFKSQSELWGGLIYIAFGAVFFASAIIFYFRLDYLFLSYGLHLARIGEDQPVQYLSLGEFALVKVVMWLFVLSWPVSFFVFSAEIPPVMKAYGGLFCLGLTLINMAFLFDSYDSYVQQKMNHVWGIASVRNIDSP